MILSIQNCPSKKGNPMSDDEEWLVRELEKLASYKTHEQVDVALACGALLKEYRKRKEEKHL